MVRPQGARAGARQPPPARFSSRSERLGATRRGMKDFQLYQQILGLTEPWRVEQVTLNVLLRQRCVSAKAAAATVCGRQLKRTNLCHERNSPRPTSTTSVTS